jgi:hypothetical protein
MARPQGVRPRSSLAGLNGGVSWFPLLACLAVWPGPLAANETVVITGARIIESMPVTAGGGGGGASSGGMSLIRMGEQVVSDSLRGESPTVRADAEPQGRTDGCKEGNPVLLSTGNKIETETDFASTSIFGLRLTRTYNAQAPGRGMFGNNVYSTKKATQFN